MISVAHKVLPTCILNGIMIFQTLCHRIHIWYLVNPHDDLMNLVLLVFSLFHMQERQGSEGRLLVQGYS